MNILFYDIVPTNIIRFYKDIVHEFSTRNDIEMFFLVEHDDSKTLRDVDKFYGELVKKSGYCQFKTIEYFKSYIENNQIDVLFINGQRIADDRVVFAAKSKGVKTYMLQHGMYVPFLERDANFFLSKLSKTISYLYYSLSLSYYTKAPALFYKYILSYVFGRNQVDLGIDRRLLNVDRVFVYSEYWKEFHSKQFGYSIDKQLVIGTPDLSNSFAQDELIYNENSICYIAQTLVEDGRLKVETQREFFENLVKLTEKLNLTLVVKLHPRSDVSLYSFVKANHVELVSNQWPKTKKYIGHYSTLLAKAMFYKDSEVTLYEYDGHNIPDYFKTCASGVTRDFDELSTLLRTPNQVKGDINKYFSDGTEYQVKVVDYVLKSIKE